jgi:RHS repeat-associated protein
MKHPSTLKANIVRPFFSRNRGCLLFLLILTVLLILALPPAAHSSSLYPENPYSSGNSMVGKNDFKTGDPIVTGSGSVDYALPLLKLGGPMGLAVSLKYNRAMNNWWSQIRTYFPTHGDANYFWLPPMSAAIDVGESGHDVILPGGEKVSFIKDGDDWVLNETELEGFRENSMPIRYAAATSGESANRFWVMDPSRDLLLVYDYTGQYWAEGKLFYAMDRNGNTLSFSYDGDRIHEITDGLGRTLAFGFDLIDGKWYLHQITDQTDADNPRSVTFAYDTNADDMGNQHALRSVTDALGQIRTFRWSVVDDSDVTGMHYDNLVKVENPKGADYFHFSNVWNRVIYKNAADDPMSGIKVTGQEDAYGNAATFSYDEDPYVTRATYPDDTTGAYAHNNAHVPPSQFTDAEDNALTLTRNARNQVTSMTDRTGGTTEVTYHEPTGKLASITNADGKVLAFTYTAQTQTFTDPDHPANEVDFTFYNLTQIDYPDGTAETFAYDAAGNVLTHTDRAGQTWTWTYNAKGQVLTATNPEGGVTTHTYNPDATLATSTDSDTDADTGQTAYTYDGTKRLTQITRPGGATVQIAYNLNNQVTSVTDERGKVYTYAYDVNGNLAAITDPDTNQTLFSHDKMDRVDAVTNARGKQSQFTYDSMNRPAAVTDPTDNTVQYGYNTRGWLDTLTDPAGHAWTTAFNNEGLPTAATTPTDRTTTFTRDSLGRISKITNPMDQETVFTRDAMSRVTKVTDPLNRQTGYTYDAAGRLTGVTLPDTTSGTTAATFTRNGLGLVDCITDLAGSQWNLGYTTMGRLASLTDPLGNAWQFDYDTRGRLDQITYPDAATLTRTHDNAGNLTGSQYSAGPDLDFTFDDQNRLLSADHIAFTYNETGQITATTDTDSGIPFGATYDDAGRIATAIYNNGQFNVTYTYDARGLLTKVTDSLTDATVDFSYDNDGRITTITRSSGVGTTFTRDAASRLTRIQHKTGAATLADLQYTRNAAGEVTALDYDLPLDPADHLASATDDLTFDAASRISTAGYTYDALGRQTAAPGHTFTWDGASRLIETADATLTYNGLSDLRTRQSGGVTIRYHYNHALDLHPLVGEYNVTAGAWKRFYVLAPGGQLLYAIDPTVAPASAAAVSFYHFDSTGNTLILTDAAGSVSDKYAYSPYGRLLAHDGSSDQPFTFAGAWQIRREGDADLYQMRARYYDARTAAFLSREPLWPRLATPAALNPYQYAARDPNRFVDVTGEAVEEIDDLWKYNKTGDTWYEMKVVNPDEAKKRSGGGEEGYNDLWHYQKNGDLWYHVNDDPEEHAKNLKEYAAWKEGQESQSDAVKAPVTARSGSAQGGALPAIAVAAGLPGVTPGMTLPPLQESPVYGAAPAAPAAQGPVAPMPPAPRNRALNAARAHISDGEKLKTWPLFWQEAKAAPGKQQDAPTEIKLSGDWHGADGQLQTAPITPGPGGAR